MAVMMVANGLDTNSVFNPCSDAVIQKSDGFTFGLAFSTKESFLFNNTLLSPCDSRLPLASMNAQLSVFRPKVDEISLLTIKGNTFSPGMPGGYMVAFAGRKYAARSPPIFVADSSHIITSFTLILEFQKGILQNLFWKKNGCDSCSRHESPGLESPFVCLNQTDCAIRTSNCKDHGGSVECNLGIQLAFSGTDKNDAVLNSWYEVKNLRQFSLFGLYSDLKDSLTGQFSGLFW
ncbi:hypothetical protein GIB67_029572 [Kingdonia uniflora]|uniref:Expp1 protein n=1 Tax=Kingdonia uniflora TaxID=39325 RepID=A0A7J7LLB9_9MAGN|nr:hypothetical protein GIB67_029572 [Kingdonia uniflora]